MMKNGPYNSGPTTASLSDFLDRFLRSAELRRYLAPCGRLEWILGLADDAPESSIAATFSPVLHCIERVDTNADLACVVGVQPLSTQRVTRTCNMHLLKCLQLGAYYVLGGTFQFPMHGLPVVTPPYHTRRANLTLDRGSFYISGGRYDLPARLREAALLHAPLPDGVTFFAYTTTEDNGSLTILLPCSEILRSCYADFTEYLHGAQRPQRETSLVASSVTRDFGYSPAGNPARVARARRIQQLRRTEPAQLLPRALVYGQRGHPRPILVKPPYIGNVVVGGEGYSYQDEQGEVLFIVSGLSIEHQFSYDHRKRTQESQGDALGHIAPFAPAFSGDDVMLFEVNARAPHGCSEIVRNYDIREFNLQLDYFDEVFEDPFSIHDLPVLRDMRKWRFAFGRGELVKHHSVALSASLLECPRPRHRKTASRGRCRPEEDS